MPIKQPVSATNDTPGKVEKVVCDCDLLWSMAHQFTYLRLSDKVADNEYSLINLFSARAKRIAATYARFYLETEDGGDPDKLGRYYWMALGAFASKTVACLLDAWQLESMYLVGAKTVPRGLGQGNLWLYTDIAASHWLYNNHPENFKEGMMCETKRDANKLEEAVKNITFDMPWASESIGTINNFKPSSYIIKGFDLVKDIEAESSKQNRRNIQLDQLLVIADHEQLEVLQPLIYDNPDFAWWADFQRMKGLKDLSPLAHKWVQKAAPTYQLTFTHACDIDDADLKSVAPDDLIIEDEQSRMDWIGEAADIFHGLMKTRNDYMTQELRTIASWVNSPDAALVY